MFTRTPEPTVDPLAQQAADLRALRQEALTRASTDAKAENRQPTLNDYFIACEQLGEQRRSEFEARGVQWNPRIYADISGMQVDGYLIRRDDVVPSNDVREVAALRAQGIAQSQGREPSNLDYLEAVRDVERNGIDAMRDLHDLDGDGSINVAPVSELYRTIEHRFNPEGASFTNVTFRPATSFSLVEHAANATFGNVSFEGLETGQTLTLGSGKHGAQERFYNVEIKVDGGDIRINDYAIVNNLVLKGSNEHKAAECSLTVGGRAQLNDLKAEGSHFLNLTAEPGAQIVRGNFNGTTIDVASNLSGSIWRNCEFSKATLRDVNLNGAQLSETHFVNTDLTNVSFAGARLSNCSISGTDISTVNATGAHFHNVSVEVSGKVHVVNSAEQFQALQQATAIGRSMANSFTGFAPAAQQAPLNLADLGRSLGEQAMQTSLTSQQAAGAGASPAEALPVREAQHGLA